MLQMKKLSFREATLLTKVTWLNRSRAGIFYQSTQTLHNLTFLPLFCFLPRYRHPVAQLLSTGSIRPPVIFETPLGKSSLKEEEEKPHSGHISMSGTSEDSDGLELFIQGQQPQKGIIPVMGKKETWPAVQ